MLTTGALATVAGAPGAHVTLCGRCCLPPDDPYPPFGLLEPAGPAPVDSARNWAFCAARALAHSGRSGRGARWRRPLCVLTARARGGRRRRTFPCRHRARLHMSLATVMAWTSPLHGKLEVGNRVQITILAQDGRSTACTASKPIAWCSSWGFMRSATPPG